MSTFKDKVDKMYNDEFVRNYLLYKDNNIKLSEKRHMVKQMQVNGSTTYFVEFEYFVIKEKSLFSNVKETATKNIRDVIPFSKKADADYYIENALCPSVYKYHIYARHLSQRMRFKQFADNDKISTYARIDNKYDSLYYYIDIEGNLYNETEMKYSLKDVDKFIREYFPYMYPIKSDVIRTIDIKGLFNIQETDIEKLRENIDKTKVKTDSIIIDEIERTTQYLELLKKLLRQ